MGTEQDYGEWALTEVIVWLDREASILSGFSFAVIQNPTLDKETSVDSIRYGKYGLMGPTL
jgi:hypothetical protein